MKMKIHRMKVWLDDMDNFEIAVNERVSVRIFRDKDKIKVGGIGWIDNNP